MLGLLSRLIADPEGSLTLVVGGARRRFSSIEDFREYLSRRIDVPGDKHGIMGFYEPTRPTSENEHREASSLKRALESHQALVSRAMVDMLMHESRIGPIDSRNFTRDHGWREIMEGLNEQTSNFDAFKYEALKMYTKYMAARTALAESDSEPKASMAPAQNRPA